MDPEDLTSFDRLLAPQYVTVLFGVGVAASVLVGLGMIFTGGAGLPFGLAVLVGGPVLTRVGCELLILAFKAVDWIAEINATLARQEQTLAEQTQQLAQATDGRLSARADGETSSSKPSPSGADAHAESDASPTAPSTDEPILPSSR